MARIDRYVLGQLLLVFGFFALILILVYWINRAVILFDQIIGDGQSIGTFLIFSALTLPGLIRVILPIAAFAAAIYVTNRMITDRELVILQSTGASALRLARPVLIFGVIGTILMTALVHLLVPLASSEFSRRQAELAQNVTARLLQDGQFLTPTQGVTFYVRDISDDGEMNNIFLSDTRGAETTLTFTAATAYLIRTEAGPQLVMLNGMIQTLTEETGRLSTTAFDELAYDIGALVRLPGPANRRPRAVPSSELWMASAALLEETGQSQARLRAEVHDRIAQSLLPLVGALLGFSALLIGQFSRFGLWRQILGAIGLIILIKGLESGATARMAKHPEDWLLLYTPALTGLALCGLLIGLSGRRRWPWLKTGDAT